MWGRAIAALGLVAGIAAVAGGQERVGPEFRVNSYTTGQQEDSVIAGDGDENFVVVWRNRPDTNPSVAGIVGQRFSRAGIRLGGEFAVTTGTNTGALKPAIAVEPSGRFVVVWQALEGASGWPGIFARRFDSSGVPLGVSEFRVNAYTTGTQIRPDVAASPTGDFVVVWSGDGQDGSGLGIFGRRFDSAGGPVGSEFQVNSYTTFNQVEPAVAMAPDGSFVVAWSGSHDGDAILARRFDSEGAPIGPEFLVYSHTTLSQSYPDVAFDGSGRFVVVWQSIRADGAEVGVAGQGFDAAGDLLGGRFVANSYTTGQQVNPTVAGGPSGDFVVAWSSPQDGDSHAIVARRFGADGSPIGAEILVNLTTASGQNRPSVASLGAEKFVVAWQSFQQDGDLWGVFAQRFGDLLFRDDFESGDTSRWSAAAHDNGDLDVSVGAAMKLTTFGLQAFADDTNGLYVQDDSPKDETAYSARFYFHPGDFDPGESLGHRRTRILIGFEEAPNRRLFALILRRIDGQYSLMGRVRLDDDTRYDTGFFPITAAPHFVEVRWARPTTRFPNGSFSLQVDGTQLASTHALDNDISTLDFVRMGALSVKTGASGTLYYDEFESRRGSPIGP